MSRCAYCGLPNYGGDVICTYHHPYAGDDWATGIRIMCNFLHRDIVPPSPAAGAGRDLEVDTRAA